MSVEGHTLVRSRYCRVSATKPPCNPPTLPVTWCVSGSPRLYARADKVWGVRCFADGVDYERADCEERILTPYLTIHPEEPETRAEYNPERYCLRS